MNQRGIVLFHVEVLNLGMFVNNCDLCNVKYITKAASEKPLYWIISQFQQPGLVISINTPVEIWNGIYISIFNC